MATSNNTVNEPTAKSAQLADLRIQICQAVAPKPIGAGDLARQLNEDYGRIYRQCRRLENEGLLLRERVVKQRHFCVDCRQVVTSATYEACRTHDQRPFLDLACEWEAMPQGPQIPQPKSVTVN